MTNREHPQAFGLEVPPGRFTTEGVTLAPSHANAGIVLGIDPGLNRTGYGVVRREGGRAVLVQGGVVRSRATDPLEQRVLEIHQGVAEVVEQFRPESVAVEELYSTYKHPKTAILMGHARGAIFLAAARHGVPVSSYSATRIKKILTGSGRADKAQVQSVIQHEFGLAALPEPNDVADALAVALCHLFAGKTMQLQRG